ncbi:MAG TPA: hypothetical protein PLJ32_07875 [Kiritimatiellia bacterium]|nr:hypothetical protein [Kiritimatiellia bacterium]
MKKYKMNGTVTRQNNGTETLSNQAEIGSHRKYSRKQPTAEKILTFRVEMATLFEWLSLHLRAGRYAAFVIGDSSACFVCALSGARASPPAES